jgi:hypothetical protein
MSSCGVPDAVRRLLWDVELAAIDVQRDRDFIAERVMARGGWEAMQWLRRTYPTTFLASVVSGPAGKRLPPRERAYWALVTGVEIAPEPGAGRPRWAGP